MFLIFAQIKVFFGYMPEENTSALVFINSEVRYNVVKRYF